MKAKKEKPKVQEPLRVYVEYNRGSEGGEALSDEEWSSRSDTIVTVEFIRLYREPPKHRFFYDSVEINNPKLLKLDKLFLAVVRYSTGDTFGHTSGEFYIVGVAPTYKIAQAMLDEETKPSPIPKSGMRHYKRWEGYFESLEDTEIHELSLV